MLGKKRYDVATVEKKMEINESSLKSGEHADDECVCEKKDDNRNKGQKNEGRRFNVEGDYGAYAKHPQEIRKHLSNNDRRGFYRK